MIANRDDRQITRYWVSQNCKYITERDMGLLRLIASRKLLRRDQIQSLYPEFASTDVLNKRLKMLYQKHIIDRIQPPVGQNEGSSKQHICLDKAGMILLELEKYNKPIVKDVSGRIHLVSNWEHRVLINDYECWLREVMSEIGGTVLEYNTEKILYYGDHKVIPDIQCVVKYKGKGYSFFIEVDNSSQHLPALRKKIDNYTSYFISAQWTQQSFAKIFKNPAFPRVIIGTHDRGVRIQKLSEYTEDSMLRFSYCDHSKFKELILSILNA